MISKFGVCVMDWYRHRPMWCVTCDKPVDRVDVRESFSTNEEVLAVKCHGATERHPLPDSQLFRFRELAEEAFNQLPTTAFIRNWAGYTIRPEKAPGRRMVRR